MGPHAPQPAPARADPLDRDRGGGREPRRLRGVARGRRAGLALLRARVRRPAGARVGDGPVCRRAGGARRGRTPGARQAGRREDRRGLRGAAGRHRHASGAGRRRAAGASVRQRAARRARRARRPERRGRGVGRGLLRDGDAGPGAARAGVGDGRARRGRRDRPVRCDAVAPHRSQAARAVSEPARGQGPAVPRGDRRRVRRARGREHADPRVHARDAHGTPGQDGVRPRGVVRRARPPAPVPDLDAHGRDARGRPRERPREDPDRRGGVHVVVDRGDLERDHVRARPLRGLERARRGHLRLHEQPTMRRDARVRRRAGVLRARGADGQARRGALDGPGRAPGSERGRDRDGPCRRVR